ncbi:hypothetical protein [Psychrobacter nivimaris]|uniref:hypothetical protein n=1 Tax=Psychrobacter nivimaris TaxID=281738 RepID=UPI001919E0EF|nr:hypothetical protein [Psychrobacter nivimaris]
MKAENLVILLIIALVLGAIFIVVPGALAREDEGHRALIIEHKYDLLDNQVADDQDNAYYASEEYQNAKHANEFIAKAYGRE